MNKFDPSIGNVAIVTGAASGLGLRISQRLADDGMLVIMADVAYEKCQREALEICLRGHSATAEYIDLSNQLSIQAFVERFKSKFSRLDLLMNNAGVMMPPFKRTAQGLEPHWAINHLGHFSLTTHLLEALASTPGSRVVFQSSIVHDTARIDFDNIETNKKIQPWKAYKQSKLATLLFALELQRRLTSVGLSDSISLACHPGLVSTPLYRNSRYLGMLLRPFMQSIENGVEPAILASTDYQTEGGDFYGPDGWKGFRGPPRKMAPLGKGSDTELAAQVWNLSKTMIDLDTDKELLRLAVKHRKS